MMHKIGYILLRALIWIPAHLPLWFHHGAAHFLCWLLRDVFHYRRDVVLTNLSRSFPDKKYKQTSLLRESGTADAPIQSDLSGTALRRWSIRK